MMMMTICVCSCVSVSHGTHAEVRGQLCGIGLSFHLYMGCGDQTLVTGHQAVLTATSWLSHLTGLFVGILSLWIGGSKGSIK